MNLFKILTKYLDWTRALVSADEQRTKQLNNVAFTSRIYYCRSVNGRCNYPGNWCLSLLSLSTCRFRHLPLIRRRLGIDFGPTWPQCDNIELV